MLLGARAFAKSWKQFLDAEEYDEILRQYTAAHDIADGYPGDMFDCAVALDWRVWREQQVERFRAGCRCFKPPRKYPPPGVV